MSDIFIVKHNEVEFYVKPFGEPINDLQKEKIQTLISKHKCAKVSKRGDPDGIGYFKVNNIILKVIESGEIIKELDELESIIHELEQDLHIMEQENDALKTLLQLAYDRLKNPK